MQKDYLIENQPASEVERWKQTLAVLQQENSYQKNTLGQMLRDNGWRNENILQVIEQYQTQFLQQDQAFEIIWSDLVEYEKLLRRNSHLENEINQRQEDFKNEILIFQLNFDKLKHRFANFIESVFEQG